MDNNTKEYIYLTIFELRLQYESANTTFKIIFKPIQIQLISTMRKINGSDVMVTKQDQANINSFSKMFQKRQELDQLLTKLKEKINQHQDTIDEIEMNNDEDMLRYRFGSCFFYLPTDQVRTLVEQDIDKVKVQQKTTKKEHEDVDKRLRKLKASLYSKFGNAINLEE